MALLKNLPKECGENQAVRVDEKCLESIRKVVDIVKRKQTITPYNRSYTLKVY